jgi:hypothetical protein
MKLVQKVDGWVRLGVPAALGFCLASEGRLEAQTVWTGPEVTFTKPDGADWTLPEYQDRITPGVWLTRADTQGLFNIAVERSYDPGTQLRPTNTEWAFAGLNGNPTTGVTAANYADLVFDTWRASVVGTPPASVGLAGVLHLISEDIYISITFNSWSVGAGGFSYTRSTVPEPAEWSLLGGLFCVGLAAWHRSHRRPAAVRATPAAA